MKRSVRLTLNPHEDGGVSLTIIKSEIEGDETTSDSHKKRITEKLPGIAAVKLATDRAISEYFDQIAAANQKAAEEDADETTDLKDEEGKTIRRIRGNGKVKSGAEAGA